MEKIMGQIIFGEPASGKSHADIVAALETAGMPANLGRELRPRFAFVRGMRELAKDGIIDANFRDKALEDNDRILFAFICKNVKGSVHYDVSAVVEYNKKSNQILVIDSPAGVSADEIKTKAVELIVRAKSTWSCADINALVKNYLGSFSKRIPLRSGVSFVPLHAEAAAQNVQKFYKALGFTFFVVPVGHSAENAESIHGAIVNDMAKEVSELVSEINSLKAEGKLTKRISKRRLSDLQKKLLQYRQLAQSTQAKMNDLLDAAGDGAEMIVQAVQPMESLLAQAQSGQRVDPFLVDLMEAAEVPQAKALKAALAMPTVQKVDFEEDIEVSDNAAQPLLPLMG